MLESHTKVGWSDSAMVLGNRPVPGRPTIWMIVGKGPIALAVGAVGLFGHFYFPLSFLFFLPLSGLVDVVVVLLFYVHVNI